MDGATLLVTVCAGIVAACPPAGVCSGLVDGLAYATVTASPYATGLERVIITLAPEIATELTPLAEELTITEKAEAAGTILARVRL